MAGFTTVAQVLSLLGSAPVKPGGTVAAEFLKIAKSIMPHPKKGTNGADLMKGLLGKVMQGGPAALLSNPMGAITGALGSQVSGLLGSVANIPGAGLLTQAISGSGGLQAALGSFGQAGDMLSGVMQAGAGQFGLLDVISHEGVLGMLGEALPEGLNVGLDVVRGPLEALDTVQGMVDRVGGMVSAVADGSLDLGAAFSAVTDMTGQINAIVGASNGALAHVQDAVLGLAQVNAVVGSIRGASDDLHGFLQSVTRPEAWDVMQEILNPLPLPPLEP